MVKLYTVIDGVEVCSGCGQEMDICDCGSGLMHPLDPDDVKEPYDDFSESAFDDFDIGGEL